MTDKKIDCLYTYLEQEETDIITETPLNLVTEREVLKFNKIFSNILTSVDVGNKNSILESITAGFKAIIYNIITTYAKTEEEAYNKANEFDTFVNSLLLNTKVFYKGKELLYPEFKTAIEDPSVENTMKFNICFFLSMFIVYSNTVKVQKVNNMTEILPLVAYIGSSSIGEFRTFVLNSKMENSSLKA